jgi:hypothetical protein
VFHSISVHEIEVVALHHETRIKDYAYVNKPLTTPTFVLDAAPNLRAGGFGVVSLQQIDWGDLAI